MRISDVLPLFLLLALLISLTPLLGRYMTLVFTGENHILKPLLGWCEKLVYRLGGVHCNTESNWKRYTFDLLVFNFAGGLVLFLLQVFQSGLPFNPRKLPDVSWHLAFNTAVSFMTNTNWQSYSGENTLSYLVQFLGLTVQNFLSAATGIAVFLALARGITRKTTEKIGNFWVDLTRAIVYVFIPLSFVFAIFLVGQGVIQNFHSYTHAVTLEGKEQLIPMGPVASQEAIKQLGTNGGGFFGANSAHPFENPTPFTNFMELLAILLIPAALTNTYGRMAGSSRQGWTLFIVMALLLTTGMLISLYSETTLALHEHLGALMEGKEQRNGVASSLIWSVATTAASNGSVNAMHDSLSPLSGMVAIVNMMLGEVVFGGAGAGMYGIIVFVILTVFIAGLMVGRTPEYLGKKIEAFEIQMSILAILAPSAVILLFSAWACSSVAGISGLNNAGPHGLTEILYAFSSAAGNNGSAFAGLNTNTVFYNLTMGAGMLAGRFGVIVPALAIAGNMAMKKTTPVSAGTFRTDTWIFAILLISVIIIIGGLTFFPALSLGPVAEHLLLSEGITF